MLETVGPWAWAASVGYFVLVDGYQKEAARKEDLYHNLGRLIMRQGTAVPVPAARWHNMAREYLVKAFFLPLMASFYSNSLQTFERQVSWLIALLVGFCWAVVCAVELGRCLLVLLSPDECNRGQMPAQGDTHAFLKVCVSALPQPLPQQQVGPLVDSFVHGNASFVQFFAFTYDTIFFVDVVWATPGYMLSCKLFDTHVRSAEPTLIGGCAGLRQGDTLLCYFALVDALVCQHVQSRQAQPKSYYRRLCLITSIHAAPGNLPTLTCCAHALYVASTYLLQAGSLPWHATRPLCTAR